MESKVILFCVLIFCSKIVDSISHPEDHVRQRVHSLPNWQGNQNAPNAQYLDTDLTQTPNVNIQQSHPGRYNYDSIGFSRRPASSPSGKDVLVGYDYSADKRRLDSYPPRQESYKSRISQVEFDNQQYRNQNLLSQRLYTNSVPSAVHIPDDERPLVTTDQEPYRSQVQYLQPKHVTSSNRRIYQPVGWLTREQYPSTRDSKYVPNSAPRFGTSGQVPYENSSEDQVATSEINARPTGDQRNLQNFDTPTEITYNEFPTVYEVATDTLTDQSENINYLKNYKSRSYLSNTPPITNYNDGTPVITQADSYNSNTGESNGPVLYKSYIEGQALASEVKTKPTGSERYPQSFASQSGVNYYKAPVLIATDTLKDQTENMKYEENFKSGSDLSYTAPLTNQDHSFPLISEGDNNSDSISSNLAYVNIKNEAPVVIDKDLSEKPLTRRYSNSYKSNYGWSNIARDDSSYGAPVVTETAEVKPGKYEANYKSDYGPKEPVPINTHSGVPSAPSDIVLVNSGSNKPEESNVAHHGFSSPTPLNTNPNQNVYNTKTSGITEFKLKSLVASPEVQKMLAGSNKRYLVIHSNGTVETMDKIDLESHHNSKLRLVHAKRKNIDDSDSDVVLTRKLPENLPNNIAKTSAPVDENPLPTNYQPADDKKPTPLLVDQRYPADESNSNLSPQLKDLPANQSNLKPLPQTAKKPVDNNNSKLLPSYVIPPTDNNSSKTETLNEHQSTLNDNLNPLPRGVNQIRDDEDSKPLTPYVNHVSVDGNSKPLSQDGNKTAVDDNSKLLSANKNQLADDDNSKLLTPKEYQPGNYIYSKLDKPKDIINFTPLFPPHVIKYKHSFVKHSANDNHLKPLPTIKNQPHDDNPTYPYTKQPAHHNKSKQPHINRPADDNNSSTSSTPRLSYPENQPSGQNSNPSSPGEDATGHDNTSEPLPFIASQPGGDNDFKPLRPNIRQPAYHNKSKQPHINRPADDNNSSTSSTPRLSYPENQPSGQNSNPSSPGEDATGHDNTSEPLPSNASQSGDDNDFKPLLPNIRQPAHHNKSKQPHINRPADDNNSSTSSTPPLSYPENQPSGQNSNPLSPGEDATGHDNTSEPLPSNASQSGDDNDFKPLRPNIRQPAHHNKSKQPHINRPADDNNSSTSSTPRLSYPENQPSGQNSNPLSPGEDATGHDNTSEPLPSNASQSGDDNDFNALRPNIRQPAHHNKSKQPHVNRPADDNNSSTSSTPRLSYLENQPSGQNSNPLSPGEDATGHDNTSEPLPSNASQSGDDNDFKPLRPNIRQPAHHNKSKQPHINRPADDNNSSTSSTPRLSYPENQPSGQNSNPSSPGEDATGHDNTSEPLPSNANQSGDDKNSNPSSPGENEPENYGNFKPSSSKKHQSRDETDFTILPSHKKQPSHKPNSRQSQDQPADDNNLSPTSTPLLNYPEYQPSIGHTSNPSSPGDDRTGDDATSKHLTPNKNQSGDDNDFKLLPAHATQSATNTKSKPSQGDQAGDNNNSNPSSPDEEEKCEDEDDLITKPTPADQSYSTTVSPTVPKYTTSSKPHVLKTHIHKHSHRKSTTNLPVVSTTPCPDDTPENQIITLSPIEQTTDNVSDVPPVETTTTTTSTSRTPGKSDIINDANNKQVDAQDDITHIYSTTTVSPSTKTPPTDNIIDGKTISTTENKNTQTKDSTVIDQVHNREKYSQTAVYNSSELFDTNTDVPAESDDYSSITPSPSVQNGVNTGDASGDNSLELEQSETDVTITVSSSKANNSEDETITINIEISESTDNADSSSNDKSLVVNIDTNDDSNDDSKTPKPEDCKKEHPSDGGRGKNVEIDMSNLKGEPTMWIRTTDQDFIDKLTAKNDTAFDVIYFFHIDNQPFIEREKATTMYCNGTVVIETTETKYTRKDDPAPTVVKKTQIVDVITDVV